MKIKYKKEQKQELVARYCNGESASDICLQTCVPRSTFYTWIKPYQVVKTASGSEVSAVNYARQKKHIEKLENMIAVLQTVYCNILSPFKVKLEELTKLYGEYSIHVLCDSLNVARGTFYNHIFRNKKENSSYKSRREKLSKLIKEVFEESNQIYGARKIQAVLRIRGIYNTDGMVAELMQEMNLKSIRSDTKRQHKRLLLQEGKKDVLKLNFSAKAPNQVWVSDVTQFRFCNTTRYICAMIDLYSRKAIAYKISQKNRTQLISATFKIAYKERQPDSGLIFHSDRGVQYAAFSFRKLLKTLNVTQSFSPTGKPRHNAVMEAFFETLKKEELYRGKYRSTRDFEQSVKDFMKRYNDERPHVTLRYKTPNAHEQAYNPLFSFCFVSKGQALRNFKEKCALKTLKSPENLDFLDKVWREGRLCREALDKSVRFRLLLPIYLARKLVVSIILCKRNCQIIAKLFKEYRLSCTL